jgi:hypothetical protein
VTEPKDRGRLITFDPPPAREESREDERNADGSARFAADEPKRRRFSFFGN